MSQANVQRFPLRKTATALIKELGSESNAHGVARIIRSRDKRRKLVWSLLVLFGVGSAISQLSSLVHKYLQYQVVEVSEIQDGLPVQFPSVTLCNIEPISWRKLRAMLNGTTSATSDVRAWLRFLETFDFGEQHVHLRSVRAFHENVAEGVLHVRHSLNDSLLHCRFNKRSCSTANFTTSLDGNYYSCFTFNAQEAVTDSGEGEEEEEEEEHEEEEGGGRRLIVHATGPEHGLSVVMFLDNNFPPLGSYGVYTLDTNILHSAGARVTVHAPNTLPIPVQHGKDVAPGYSTSVAVRPVLHARLDGPYGNCSDVRLRGLGRFSSTYSTCIAVCKQELVVRQCRCRSSALPPIPALLHVPYCGHVPQWRHMVRHARAYNRTQRLPKLQCELRALERLTNDRGYEAECGCNHPCGELSYHMTTSMSYWPTELYQFHALKQLYKDRIHQSPLSRAYTLHERNIKAGEELLQQASHHGQSDMNATASPAENRDREAQDSSPGEGSASGFSESSEMVDAGTRASSSQRSEFPHTPADLETRGAGAEQPLRHDHLSDGQSTKKSMNSSQAGQTSRKRSPNSQRQDDLKGRDRQPLLEYNSQQLDNLREASTEIRQNLLRLNVYLEDLNVVKYKQMPAYGMEDLFADIGGTLGLWMGVSVLTIMELLELIIRLSHVFFKAEWRPATTDSNEDQCPNSENRRTEVTGSEVWELNTRIRNFSTEKSCSGWIHGNRERKERDCSFRERHAEHQREDLSSKDTDTKEKAHNCSKGYSYRSEPVHHGSERAHVSQTVLDMNSHTINGSETGRPDHRTRPGRTSYWRLKWAKRKT